MPRLDGILADTTPLRVSPPFRRLWWGLGVSNLGSQLTVVAVGLQVYALTGSTLAVGVLGIFALVPLVALGLYGGALVDAYDRRKVALLASWALWVVTGLLALQAWLDVGSVGVLYGLVALQSAAFAINNPARSAIIPRLVEPRLLPAANALQTISWSIALTVGPLLGAFLVALWGYGIAYSIDVVLFAAALWAVWRLPSIPPVLSPEDTSSELDRAPHRGTSDDVAGGEAGDPAAPRRKVVGISSVVDGLRYLATRPNVRTTFLVDLAAMILAFPRVLLPAVGVLFIGGGETTTGVLSAAFAVGAVLAGVFSGALSRVRWQGLVIAWAITAWGLSIAAFGAVLLLVGSTDPPQVLVGGLAAACIALALAGASDAVSAVFRQTILQTATPDDMRGRLQGVFIVVVAGGPRLGEVVLGAQASWFGEAWAAVAGGLACIVVVWLILRTQPRFLRYDALHPEP
ncbi:MFS transporter [Oerskovia enterophila]|uniref:Enterobactin exporter EntS n=1 Tax=Oerskovia enterophila TaxID=43678 RepID=A0ABX2Y990_9CELL|nr:MFS transporter [Oerskovia enterophila]OCI33134.1 enterobactin exporter EntS [Oerskovia enterophila]